MQNDGRIAQVSKKNIAKMLSDKAISKSVNNGFSELEHIEAVKDIQELYTRARFIETHKDLKHNDPAIIIHRYKAEVDSNTEALITLKETIEGKYRGNKIYTLELEGLEKSASKSHESLTLPKHNAVSRNTTDSFIVTPTAKPESKLSTKSHEKKHSTLDSLAKDFDTSVASNMSLAKSNSTIDSKLLSKAQAKYKKSLPEKEYALKNDTILHKKGRDMQDGRLRLLDVEKKINYAYLKNIADEIPQALSESEFLAQFGDKKRVHIKTPIKEVEIQPKLVWEHLQQQSNKKEDRNNISGAIIKTLQEPLFVTKDTKETFYFYKPFLILRVF